MEKLLAAKTQIQILNDLKIEVAEINK